MPPDTASPQPPSFPRALSDAISAHGVPLATLAQQLREAGFSVSVATLSYWQSGRSLPTRKNSIRAVRVLESLLGLEPTTLIRLLPGEAATRWDPISELSRRPGVSEALQGFGLGLSSGADRSVKFLEQAATISADGRRQVECFREVFSVEVERLTHIPVIFEIVEGDPTPPFLTAIAGCRVAGNAPAADASLMVVDLELTAPLTRGGFGMVEYSITWDISAATEQGMVRAIPDGVDYMVQSVRFEGPVPRRVDRYEVNNSILWSHEGARDEESLAPEEFVQQVLSAPTGGALGLEWSH